LIDKLYGKWLWCAADRRVAIRFLEKKSYLFNLLSAMYALSGKDKQSQHYFKLAVSLADKELCERPVQHQAKKST
jgi:hypothetical protein